MNMFLEILKLSNGKRDDFLNAVWQEIVKALEHDRELAISKLEESEDDLTRRMTVPEAGEALDWDRTTDRRVGGDRRVGRITPDTRVSVSDRIG